MDGLHAAATNVNVPLPATTAQLLLQEFRALVRIQRAIEDWQTGRPDCALQGGTDQTALEHRLDALITDVYARIADIGWRLVEPEAGQQVPIEDCAEVLLHLCDRDETDLCARLTIAVSEHVVARDRCRRDAA